ncbi:MAG: hypothetical protein PHT40_02795 [Patescibacteria group bacterium]|nr:hypothetical protein [Patescibacteria group bacterium]
MSRGREEKKYYFYDLKKRIAGYPYDRGLVAVSEKKLPARTSGKCAPALPRIPSKTKIGTKGRLVIGDPRVTREKLELVSKDQQRLPKGLRGYKLMWGGGPWWTFRFPTGERIYLRWFLIAWLKK